MEYVVEKNEETDEIYLIGRFKSKGVAEIWQNGKWVESSTLHSSMLDGLLEDISETEAMKLISQEETLELQAA